MLQGKKMVKNDPMPLTKEEKDKILEEARMTNEFDYLLYMVLVTTGRRIGELYGLEETKVTGRKKIGTKSISIEGKWMEVDRTVPTYKKLGKWKFGIKVSDINFDRDTMLVWVLKRRNYVQDETVLSPTVAKLLKNYIRINRLNLEDYVFRKEGRTYRNINNVLKKYAKQVGVPTEKVDSEKKKSLSVHSFRHYFITELLRKGWTYDQIMVFTGHKTPAVLKTYSHIVPHDLKEKIIEVIEDI